jgi:hypothetical protein
VIALGTLAVFSLLVLAFSNSIRSRRLAARASADDVRARHLLYVALSRSISQANAEMRDTVYPAWPDGEALPSPGTSNCIDILADEALAAIPASLHPDVLSTTARWVYAVSTAGETNGRVGWVTANCSGLLDANQIGGESRTVSTNVQELGIVALPDLLVPFESVFYSRREAYRRYESVDELSRLNAALLARPVSDLFTYSYDPGRDAYYTALSDLGSRSALFPDKFSINAVRDVAATTYDAYRNDPAFMGTTCPDLDAVFTAAGFTDPDAMTWNVINYIDGDRLPQSLEAEPWLSSRVSEAIPLINELVISEVGGAPDNTYQVAVELWFPFLPATVEPGDGFSLEVGVFSNALSSSESDTRLSAGTLADWSFRTNITSMAYGGPQEFLVARSPTSKQIAVPHPTNSTQLLELGEVVTYSAGSPPSTVTLTNTIWFLARVVQNVNGSNAVVDQAWAPAPAPFNTTGAWSTDDPRANGAPWHWEPETATLGSINTNCSAWSDPEEPQGLPIYHTDAAMVSIGELGHVFLPATATSRWQTIDLYAPPTGYLMDRLTVRGTNRSARGLVAIGTSNPEVTATLFRGAGLGYSNGTFAATGRIDAASAMLAGLALSQNGPYQGFADLVSRNAPAAMKECATNSLGGAVNDIVREAPLRAITELVTFRQNIFSIILLAEALGVGGRAPVARKQAVAVVHRDAYTGRVFLRSLRMLKD